MYNFLKNKKGTATSLLGLISIFLAIMMFALIFDVSFILLKRHMIKQALDFSNLAVYRAINTDKLSESEVFVDNLENIGNINNPFNTTAEETFAEYICKNLNLNNTVSGPQSLEGLILVPKDKSIAANDVTIRYFEIYNPDELPTQDPFGNIIDEVAVHSFIEVPIKPIFTGLFTDEITIPVAITTDAPEGIL